MIVNTSHKQTIEYLTDIAQFYNGQAENPLNALMSKRASEGWILHSINLASASTTTMVCIIAWQRHLLPATSPFR